MNIYDLTITQLKRAVTIKEELSKLGNELRSIFDGSNRSGTPSRKRRTMSASAKQKIATAQKARWAKAREESQPMALAKTAGSAPAKRTMSASARRRIAAAQRARWAKWKAGQRKAA